MFDTLTYTKQLEAAGFPPKQAEALAMALLAVVDENLATKQDIENLRAATAHDIEELRGAIRLGGLIVVAVGALAVLQKVL
jgi:hypothetical protein